MKTQPVHIKVTFIPSDYELVDYLHFTSRSLIYAIRDSGSGVVHHLTGFNWREL